jgi:hypothetical protein
VDRDCDGVVARRGDLALSSAALTIGALGEWVI